MTAQDFRRIALSMPEASKSAHMGHPDFRVGRKIFATLGYPNEHTGVVMLSPNEQEQFVRANPTTFSPVKGTWGRRGSTQVNLGTITAATLRRAILAGWRNKAPRRLIKQHIKQ